MGYGLRVSVNPYHTGRRDDWIESPHRIHSQETIPHLPEMIERALEKLAKTFRIEQSIRSTENTLTLVTYSYIGKKVIYTHELDLLPLLDEMKKRL